MLSWEKLLSPATEVTCWNSCCASSANFIDPSVRSPCTVSLLPSSVPRQRWSLTSSCSSQTVESSVLVTNSLENGSWDEMQHSDKHAPSILGEDSCVTLSSPGNDVKQPRNSTKSTFQQGSDEESEDLRGDIIAHSFSVESFAVASGAVGGPARGVRTSRKRECQDETAATESSIHADIFSETAGSHAGTSTSQASALEEEQEPEIEMPAIIAPPFSEDSILSSYTKNISVDEIHPKIVVGDAASIRSFRIPILRGTAARVPKAASEREKQSVGECGRRSGAADDVGTISTKTMDEDLRWKEIARGFVPGGANSFLAVHRGDRKAFHNFVFRRRRRSLIPKLELNMQIAAPTIGNSVESAPSLHTESPNAPGCRCTTGTEGAGSSPVSRGLPSRGCGDTGGRQRVGAQRPLKCQHCGSTKVRLFKTAIPSVALHRAAAHRHTKNDLRKLLSVQEDAVVHRDAGKGDRSEIPRRLEPITPKEGFGRSEWDARSPWLPSARGEAKCGISSKDGGRKASQDLGNAESSRGWKKGWRHQEPFGSR